MVCSCSRGSAPNRLMLSVDRLWVILADPALSPLIPGVEWRCAVEDDRREEHQETREDS